MSRLKDMQIRNITSNLETREVSEDGKLYLEGYFVVFNEETELFKGGYEEVDKKAFNNTLDNDIRCLINHDTTLVLGRNKSKTLELKVDSTGLYGKVEINKDDSDAMNIYQRVKRGDVSGNSFGFNILNEETDYREDGTIKWIIKEIDLHEVSVTTFPAYEQTSIQARKQQHEQHEKRKKELVKNKLKERLNKIC